MQDQIKSLPIEQKVAFVRGADMWHSGSINIDGKHITPLLMTDGPHGLRLADEEYRKKTGESTRRATAFPPAVTQACGWSEQLSYRIGRAIGEECVANGVGMILGPGINIKRDPRNGRNFEYFSEDPFLSGELGSSFVLGVQSCGVASCVKHFAVNNQESWRMGINSIIDERSLFDIYLRGFERVIQKGKTSSIMSSYNKLNGILNSQNKRLLKDILRDQFEFVGMVVSDWGAVYQRCEGLIAGLDLEMPSSGKMNDYEILEALKVESEQLNKSGLQKSGCLECALNESCRNVLKLVIDHNLDSSSFKDKLVECDYESHHSLAVEVATKSIVLLKNTNNSLPIIIHQQSSSQSNTGIPTVLVIGEMGINKNRIRIQGGGSSFVNARVVIPFIDALCLLGDQFGQQKEDWVEFTQGYDMSDHDEMMKELMPKEQLNKDNIKREGEKEKESSKSSEGEQLNLRTISRCQQILIDQAVQLAKKSSSQNIIVFLGLPEILDMEGRDRNHLQIPSCHIKLLKSIYQALRNKTEGEEEDEQRRKKIIVVLSCGGVVEVREWINWCDALICCHLAGEGAGEALVNVMFSEEDHQSKTSDEESHQHKQFRFASPSGKLAETWPVSLYHSPSFRHFPSGPREVTYNESLFVGYRYFDTLATRTRTKIGDQNDVVQFPFGFGLSYTNFEYSELEVTVKKKSNEAKTQSSSSSDQNEFDEDSLYVEAQLTITNTGAMIGEEIVQLYVERGNITSLLSVGFEGMSQNESKDTKYIPINIAPSSHSSNLLHQYHPKHELLTFTRVGPIGPGEKKRVILHFPVSRLSFFHPIISPLLGTTAKFLREQNKKKEGLLNTLNIRLPARVLGVGNYTIEIGSNSRDIRLQSDIVINPEVIAQPIKDPVLEETQKPLEFVSLLRTTEEELIAHSSLGFYGSFTDNEFPDQEFAKIFKISSEEEQKSLIFVSHEKTEQNSSDLNVKVVCTQKNNNFITIQVEIENNEQVSEDQQNTIVLKRRGSEFFQGNESLKQGDFSLTTPLGLIKDSFLIKMLASVTRIGAKQQLKQFCNDSLVLDVLSQCVVDNLPLNALATNSQGQVSRAALQKLVDKLNGQGSTFGFIRELIRKAPK